MCEYDKLSGNKNAISKSFVRNSMKDNTYSKVEMEKNDMQIILEFPHKPCDETVIRKEVTSILTNIVQEYLTKTL